jgi:acyl carrier protein
MATDSVIADQILTALAEYLKRDNQSIELDNRLRDDLGLDSIATIELLFQLEEVFDLQIPDEDLQDLVTVRDVVNYIEKRVMSPPSKKGPRQPAKAKHPKG